MKVKIIFTCGCEDERKLDGRWAQDRSDVRKAKENEGVLKRTHVCEECKTADLIRFMNTLNRDELVAALSAGVRNFWSTRQLLTNTQIKKKKAKEDRIRRLIELTEIDYG